MNPVDVQIGAMFAHLDDDYELGAGRCDPNSSYKDCSGFCNMGLNAARDALGLAEIPCWQADTFQFEALGRSQGLLVPLETAYATRGMWVGWNHDGHGHMATSLGDGRQIAARSHALDLGVWPIRGSGWEWAMKPPGLEPYLGKPGGAPLPGPTTTTEAQAMGMTAKRVPETHVQAHPRGWLNRYPMVAAIEQPNDHTTIVGFNGAVLKNAVTGAAGTPYAGMHVIDLGVLHKPIGDFDLVADDPTVHLDKGHYRMVGLAGDGGTFVIEVSAYYPDHD